MPPSCDGGRRSSVFRDIDVGVFDPVDQVSEVVVQQPHLVESFGFQFEHDATVVVAIAEAPVDTADQVPGLVQPLLTAVATRVMTVSVPVPLHVAGVVQQHAE